MVYQPYLNFAAASSYETVNAALFYRNQWTGFEGAPVTYGLGVAIPIPKKNSIKHSNSTIGLSLRREEIGIHRNDALSIDYGYRFQLNRSTFVSFSLSPTLRFLNDNFGLTILNDVDPFLNQTAVSKTAPNFKFGSYLFKNDFYVGFTTANLLYNNIYQDNSSYAVETGFDPKKINYILHSGYQYHLNRNNSIITSGLIQIAEGANLHYNLNVLWSTLSEKLGIGASYRSTNSLVFITNFQIHKQFKLSYAYQYSLSELSNYQNGSHELLLVYQVKPKKKLIRIRTPRF
jgi:type IX secretion system PorP/SprF family membrane protein